MDTTRLQENISAMVDGELPDCDVELTMAGLAGANGRARWHAYQLIGDVLRAEAGASGLSGTFAARLAQRLAQEPFPSGPPDEAAPAQASAPLPSQAPSSPPSSPPGDGAAAAVVGTR